MKKFIKASSQFLYPVTSNDSHSQLKNLENFHWLVLNYMPLLGQSAMLGQGGGFYKNMRAHTMSTGQLTLCPQLTLRKGYDAQETEMSRWCFQCLLHRMGQQNSKPERWKGTMRTRKNLQILENWAVVTWSSRKDSQRNTHALKAIYWEQRIKIIVLMEFVCVCEKPEEQCPDSNWLGRVLMMHNCNIW